VVVEFVTVEFPEVKKFTKEFSEKLLVVVALVRVEFSDKK
jgi:hypothetical protein